MREIAAARRIIILSDWFGSIVRVIKTENDTNNTISRELAAVPKILELLTTSSG